jgi:hypothetical protein
MRRISLHLLVLLISAIKSRLLTKHNIITMQKNHALLGQCLWIIICEI